jgi:hypothetical protein
MVEPVSIAIITSASVISVSTLATQAPRWYASLYDWINYTHFTEVLKSQDEHRFYQLLFKLDSLIAANPGKYATYNKSIITLPFQEERKDENGKEFQEVKHYCLTVFAPDIRCHLDSYGVTLQILGDQYGTVYGFRFLHYRFKAVENGLAKFLFELGTKVYLGSPMTVLPTVEMIAYERSKANEN